MHLNPAFVAYIVLWLTACAFAVGFCVRNRGEFAPFHTDYWRFLFVPWKLVIFAVALAGMLWLGPRSGDPTWDWVDASFMSALTYVSAPWALGVLWRTARRRLAWWQAYVAACLWMFSASWSYDLYILLRDGRYPPSWLANMLASSILYLLAGLLWNVDWSQSRGVTFAFLHEGWPRPTNARGSSQALLLAVPIMVLVAVLMLAFFLHAR